MGKIYFLLVRIKIKHMELAIIKKETTGTGTVLYHDSYYLLNMIIIVALCIPSGSSNIVGVVNELVNPFTPELKKCILPTFQKVIV